MATPTPTATARPDGTAPSSRWPDGHPRRRTILAILCLALLVVVIDNTVLNTALPTLARVLPAGIPALQWITDAYTLCFAALLIPAGALGDRYGRRRALVGGLILFGLASLAAAFAPDAGVLIADRVLMGLGAAFVMPATLSILSAVYPPAERPRAIATWAAVTGVGIVVGPTLGGALLLHFAWGSIFLVNIPLVIVALAGVLAVVPETAEPGPGGFDWAGTLLAGAALFALVDTIIEAPDRGWTSPLTLVEGAAAVVLGGLFIRWEKGRDHPMVDLRVFTNRAFSAATASVGVTLFALMGSLFVLTQYLQLVHGYSPLSAGLRALPFAAALGAVSPVSNVLTDRLGSRLVLPAGLGLMALGLIDLSGVGVGSAYPGIAGAVAVMGAGMGLVMAPASTTIMATVPAHQAGVGSAVNDTVREVGGALGVAVVGSISAALYRHQLSGVLATHRVPGAVVHVATGSIAAADAVGAHVGGTRGTALVVAAHHAFTSSMATGMRVSAAVALAGAVLCFLALPRRRSTARAVDRRPGSGGARDLVTQAA